MKNIFKKGLILGGLLAAAAAWGFSLSKEGKELSENLQDDAKQLAAQLKTRLRSLQDVTKEHYDELVETVVSEYAKKKELTQETSAQLVSALKQHWDRMQKEYEEDANES